MFGVGFHILSCKIGFCLIRVTGKLSCVIWSHYNCHSGCTLVSYDRFVKRPFCRARPNSLSFGVVLSYESYSWLVRDFFPLCFVIQETMSIFEGLNVKFWFCTWLSWICLMFYFSCRLIWNVLWCFVVGFLLVRLPPVLFRCVYPPTMELVWHLSEVEHAPIDVCGLTHLLSFLDICVNHGILTTLVERFHSEHNTFHLSVGELTITPEDVYRILYIPFARDKVDYDSGHLPRLQAVRHVFRDPNILTHSISWDILMSRYSEEFPLACVLAWFIGYFLMPDRGQQNF